MFDSRPATKDTVVKVKPEDVRFLAFGVGGSRGLGFAGGLYALADVPGFDYNNIEGAVGASIGSVAALAVCLGLTPDQMLEELSSFDPKTLKDPGSYWERGKRVVEGKHYFYKGEVIYKLILQLLQKVTGRNDPENISLEDLDRAGYKKLYILAAKLVDREPEPTTEKFVFCAEKTPKVSVAEAICASCAALPYFRARRIQCNESEPVYKFVDAAYKDSLPGGFFDYPIFINKEKAEDAENAKKQDRRHKYLRAILDYENQRKAIKDGIIVDRQHNPGTLIFSLVDAEESKPFHQGNIVDVGRALINGTFTRDDNTLDPRNDRTVEIPKGDIKFTDFNLSDEKQKERIVVGSKGLFDYFDIEQDPSYYKNLCAKIDAIKEKNKKQKASSYFGFVSKLQWPLWKSENTQTQQTPVTASEQPRSHEPHKARL